MEQPQNISDQLQSIRNDLTLISLQDKRSREDSESSDKGSAQKES